MKTMGFVFSVLSLMMAGTAGASVQSDDYFRITSVEVTPVELGADAPISSGSLESIPTDETLGFGAVPYVGELETIVAVGKQIWEIIEANRPVVNVSTNKASAFPLGYSDWQLMNGWQTPTSQAYRVVYRNAFGNAVIDFTFKLIYSYGGSVKGKGQYLANVTIVPADLYVSWGFKFNANVVVAGVTNAGSAGRPLAGMEIQLQYTVESVLMHSQGTEAFYVRGDGFSKAL